jgi:hypothetical protein
MNIDKLKQAIQVANPEIMGDWSGCAVCGTMCGGMCDNDDGNKKTMRPIRLADVLLALQSSKIWIGLDDSGAFVQFDASKPKTCSFLGINWNLSNDNLDHQSDETKQFLINLLCN